MSRRNLGILAGASAVTLALAGCGGGAEVSSIPPPPPPPTPTPPPPTPTPAPPPTVPAGYEKPTIFPGLEVSTIFDTVGAELTGNAAAPVTTKGISVRYDAATDLYVFELPSGEPGGFYANVSDATGWSGGLLRPSNMPPGTIWPPMTILKSVGTDQPIDLTYTRVAAYSHAGPMEDLPHGYLAFGFGTPTDGVPVTGTASYTAGVAGASIDDTYIVGGEATLQFDFAQGTLDGHFDPLLYTYYGNGTGVAIGRYDFTSTVFGVGSRTFSGELSNSAVPGTGTFNGEFTGPHAEELMSNWVAPFRDPANGQSSTITGVWAGKRN